MTLTQDNTVQRRSVAMTISIVLHALLVLFLILYKIITPLPPFQENTGGGNGLELALGMDVLGMGDNAHNDAPKPPANVTPPPTPVDETALLTSTTDESPEVKDPKKIDPKKTDPKKTDPKKLTQAEKDKVFANKLNNMWNTHGSGETGHGASDTPGNAGGANGSPNGNGIGNGIGSYRGDGFTIDLVGYKILKKPVINDKFDEAGKLVLDIWVDPDGKVLRVGLNNSKAGASGSQKLFEIAKRAALDSKFYPNPKAVGEQHGTMTFTFDLK